MNFIVAWFYYDILRIFDLVYIMGPSMPGNKKIGFSNQSDQKGYGPQFSVGP